MLLHRFAGLAPRWLAGRQRGRLPDPGGQQDHRGREWQHVQDDDRPGGYLLLGDLQAGEEQDRQPARNGRASPQRHPHEQRCHVDAEEIGVFEPAAEPGIEGCHQELRGRVSCRVGRGGGGEVGEDQDFDDGPAEGPDSPDQRRDRGQGRTAVSAERGDRRIRDGQRPQPENRARARDVELCRCLAAMASSLSAVAVSVAT